jgi:drug/metabolite transporter (DMT)-like permease
MATISGQAVFQWKGIVFVFLATVLSGLRWGLTQVLGEEIEDARQALVCLYHFIPWGTLAIIPAALVMEFGKVSSMQASSMQSLWAAILFSAIIAFFLIVFELALLNATSSLTMGVFGAVKEILQIGLAMLIFSDHLSVLNSLGLVVAVAGTFGYKVLKQQVAARNAGYLPLQRELEVFDEQNGTSICESELEIESPRRKHTGKELELRSPQRRKHVEKDTEHRCQQVEGCGS